MKQNFWVCILSLISFALSNLIEGRLDFPQYCLYHGYPTETHIIRTKDGYNLKFFRLQTKNESIKARNKVVYLQHGLEDSADTWVLNSQHLAPGFVLANKGYDVWVGNVRGNHYSNPQLSPKIKDYWNFTFDQMIKYDLPAAFQYIYSKTQKKIHYIGHSQGTMIMFGALSEGNSKIKNRLASYSAIGPATYLTNQDSIIFKAFSDTPLIKILNAFEVKQLLYTGAGLRHGLAYVCQYVPSICNFLLGILSEKNNTVNNLERISIYMSRFPCGSSVKNFQHFKQLMKSNKFCKFDYGQKRNIQIYGTKQPPVYDLKNFVFPVHFFVGEYDRLADLPDAQRLYNQIGSKQKTFTLLRFGHMSFVWAKDMSYVNQMIKIIQQNN